PAIGYQLSAIGYLPSLRPNQPALHTMLSSLGRLYECGVAVNWSALHEGQVRRRIVVPTYPFQRQRYWVEARPHVAQAALRPLVDRMLQVTRRHETIFEKRISTTYLPFLAEHQVYGMVVVPGAFYLALILSGADLLFDGVACVVEDVVLPQALALEAAQERVLQLVVTAEGSDTPVSTFELASTADKAGGAEQLHATGRMARLTDNALPLVTLERVRARCDHALDPEELYHLFATLRIDLGPHFQWCRAIWTHGSQEVLARLERPTELLDVAGYPLFPSLLDACFQVTLAGALADGEAPPETLLPFALERLTWYQTAPDEELWVHAVASPPSTRSSGARDARWDVTLFTASGAVVAALHGFQMRAAPASAITGSQVRNEWLQTLAWQPQPLPTERAEVPDCWLLVGVPERLAAELAATAPVERLPLDEDVSQQVATLAMQYGSVGVVFWGSGVRGQGSGSENHPTPSQDVSTDSGTHLLSPPSPTTWERGPGGEGHPSIAENPIAAPPAAFPPSPALRERGPGGEGHPSIAENPIAAPPAAFPPSPALRERGPGGEGHPSIAENPIA
ncbi:MAG: hypothetical protein EI684_16660, partial [Candidatus Viridilinea halotolerans]